MKRETIHGMVLLTALLVFRRGARPDRPASLLERRARQEGHPRVRARRPPTRPARSTCRRGAHRHLRQRRHALGRAADLHAGRRSPSTGSRPWRPEHPEWKTEEPFKSVLAGERAGDGQVHPPGPREDRLRDPQRDDRGCRSTRTPRTGSPRRSTRASTALHRTRLPADAGGDAATCAPMATGPTS